VVYGHCHGAWFHLMRGDGARAAPHATPLVDLTREHSIPLYAAYGSFLVPWSRWQLTDRNSALTAMRSGIALCREQGAALYIPAFETALAAKEAEAGELDTALATLDRAIAETDRTGQRWFESETHRFRGNILLKRDPNDIAPAKEALCRAVAVAQRQKARSLELRAALSLARLYQSTGRVADAQTALAPAVEGFSPTPEFPEIAEAQALLTGDRVGHIGSFREYPKIWSLSARSRH
jgi:predicted ATPase